MVLIADVVGDDENAVAQAASEIVRLANLRHGEGFIAVSAEARKKFWLDRARTAAIAKHTNAFKINEDVVIPLPRMGDYCDGIERINIELSLHNKLKLLDALDEFFNGELPLHYQDDQQPGSMMNCSATARNRRANCWAEVRARWQWLRDNLDAASSDWLVASQHNLTHRLTGYQRTGCQAPSSSHCKTTPSAPRGNSKCAIRCARYSAAALTSPYSTSATPSIRPC